MHYLLHQNFYVFVSICSSVGFRRHYRPSILYSYSAFPKSGTNLHSSQWTQKIVTGKIIKREDNTIKLV